MCPCGARPAAECPVARMREEMDAGGASTMTFLVLGPYGMLGILDVDIVSLGESPRTQRMRDMRSFADALRDDVPDGFMPGARYFAPDSQPFAGLAAVA